MKINQARAVSCAPSVGVNTDGFIHRADRKY